MLVWAAVASVVVVEVEGRPKKAVVWVEGERSEEVREKERRKF